MGSCNFPARERGATVLSHAVAPWHAEDGMQSLHWVTVGFTTVIPSCAPLLVYCDWSGDARAQTGALRGKWRRLLTA